MLKPVGAIRIFVSMRKCKDFEFWETKMSHIYVNTSGSTVVTIVMCLDNAQIIGNNVLT